MGELIATKRRPPTDHVNRLQALLKQLRESPDLLDALCATQLSITDVMGCRGAGVVLTDQVRTLGECDDTFARQLIDRLQSAETGARAPQIQILDASSTAPKSVLAVPFGRTEAGWLFWCREQEASEDSAWSQSDQDTAAQLSHELVEVLLERAQDMITMQRQLISNLGHGLCNPLQSISMSAALLKAPDRRSIELRGHISLASESMEHQINRMLEVNRLHSGEPLRINPTPTNVSSLVASEASRQRNTAPGLDLKASIESDIVAQIDPERLAQALRHLLNNAQQHATAETPIQLQLKHDPDNGDILLTLCNHADQLDRRRFNFLFSPLMAGGDKSHHGSRLGVGLYVTANIVRAHGGRISASQADGRITFQIRLPAHRPAT